MRPNQEVIRTARSLVAVALVAAAEALCQERQAGNCSPQRRIVISIPDRKLALIENGRVVKIYPTAVGAEATPSPAGSFTIVHRIPNPAWYGAGKTVPAGRNNPLGTRWLGLSRKSYGIHGTNAPSSIGRNASHGCIRMRNRDVEELFEMVALGDVVELRGERDAELAQIFGAVQTIAAAANAGGGQ
jgi:lipoprotein-anchoring transpeptidase ErfK/SrfK